jgi:hypothetical protein
MGAGRGKVTKRCTYSSGCRGLARSGAAAVGWPLGPAAGAARRRGGVPRPRVPSAGPAVAGPPASQLPANCLQFVRAGAAELIRLIFLLHR